MLFTTLVCELTDIKDSHWLTVFPNSGPNEQEHTDVHAHITTQIRSGLQFFVYCIKAFQTGRKLLRLETELAEGISDRYERIRNGYETRLFISVLIFFVYTWYLWFVKVYNKIMLSKLMTVELMNLQTSEYIESNSVCILLETAVFRFWTQRCQN